MHHSLLFSCWQGEILQKICSCLRLHFLWKSRFLQNSARLLPLSSLFCLSWKELGPVTCPFRVPPLTCCTKHRWLPHIILHVVSPHSSLWITRIICCCSGLWSSPSLTLTDVGGNRTEQKFWISPEVSNHSKTQKIKCKPPLLNTTDGKSPTLSKPNTCPCAPLFRTSTTWPQAQTRMRLMQ